MRLISSITVLIICTIQNISCECDGTLVEVQQGSLCGELVDSIVGTKQYYSYKGIPYAKPPIGDLRFKAPEDPVSWDGVRDATAHGNVCPQYNPITATYTAGSEDCLFLNVYSPKVNCTTEDELKPVMVFIHGGAYLFGSGNTDLYGPDFIVTKDIVLVTINYRLSMLGFLCLGTEEVPGNAGLKDQVAALKWVQNNIKNFGGNPNSVTIIGDTAGGASVSLHLLSPMSKGLFHKAIAISGTYSCDFGLTYKPEVRARVFHELLNYPETDNTTEILTNLQAASYDLFFNTSLIPTVMAEEEKTVLLFKMEHFTPVKENDFGNNFLTEDPNELLKCGNVNSDVDVMFSYSSQEALLLIDLFYASYIDLYHRYPELFVPAELLIKCTKDVIMYIAKAIKDYYFGCKTVSIDNIDLFVGYASNASIAYHGQRFANKWYEVGKKTFFFVFDYYSSLNVYGLQGAKYGIEKTSHFDIVFYLFNPVSLNRTVSTDSIEYEMIENITTAVTNFAKNSDPSVCDVTWPQYDNSTKAYMNFGTTGLTLNYGPAENDYNFWKSMFEYANVDF